MNSKTLWCATHLSGEHSDSFRVIITSLECEERTVTVCWPSPNSFVEASYCYSATIIRKHSSVLISECSQIKKPGTELLWSYNKNNTPQRLRHCVMLYTHLPYALNHHQGNSMCPRPHTLPSSLLTLTGHRGTRWTGQDLWHGNIHCRSHGQTLKHTSVIIYSSSQTRQ